MNHSGNRQKSSQNKMATVLLKSSIGHLSMLHTHCYHVIIGIKPCHPKLVLSISPRESVWGGLGLTASGKYLTVRVTGLNPLNKYEHDLQDNMYFSRIQFSLLEKNNEQNFNIPILILVHCGCNLQQYLPFPRLRFSSSVSPSRDMSSGVLETWIPCLKWPFLC